MTARQEDFVFAEHVLRHGYATEEQVQECLGLLERLKGEMDLEDTLQNLLVKKGYLAPAQAQVVEREINPEAGKVKNAIPGYQLIGRIGSGAMGSVYKAHHRKLDIPVALKVLRPSLAASRTQIERLQREARLAAQLSHPNIVRSLDVGESRGWHYMAMEFVEGSTVRERLHKGPLPEKEALRIVKEVAKALDHAHAHGVIHRDVKPGNIMLTPGGKVKLADFGLARGKGPSDLTLEHASIGTPQYLAPEQAMRGSNATHRSDLFSLGASLYHMATGRPPFAGENLGEIFNNVIHCRFEPPERLQKDLSLDTVYVIHRLMRANPKERYANAGELVDDLERMEKGERVAPPDFLGDYARYLRRRRARLAAVATLAIAVVGVGATLAVSSYRRHSDEVALRQRCAVVDGTGADRIDGLKTAAQLRTLHGELRGVRAETDCPDELLAGLQGRLARLESDGARIARAGDFVARAREPGAPFHELHEAVRGERGGYFKLTDEYVEDAAKTVAELSDRAQRARKAEVYGAGQDRTDLVDALKAFEQDLKDRYLDAAGDRTQVSLDRQAAEKLFAAWQESEDDLGSDFDKAVAERRFDDAWTLLDRFVDRRVKALARHPLSAPLLRHFRLPEDPEADLRNLELTLFEDEIGRPARGLLEEGRPEEAERRLLTARWQAHFTAGDLNLLKKRATEAKQARIGEQLADLARLRAEFDAALRARRVLRPIELVRKARERTDWVPDAQELLETLERRAASLAAIYNHFRTKARERQLEPSADDPYLFQGTGRKAEERLFSSMPLRELWEILALDDAKPGHSLLRGYVHAMEAHADPDPRERKSRARDAVRGLGPNDPWAVELEKVAAADLEPREVEAEGLFQEFLDSRKRKDHEIALQKCRELLDERRDGLRYTRYIDEDRRRYLEDERDKLRRLVGGEQFRISAGLPPDGLREDADSGISICTFTFREWFPDEREVPLEVRDRGEEEVRRWLMDQGRRFWESKFRSLGIPEAEWPERYRRARFQLRLFNDAADVDGSGGAVLQAGRLRELFRDEPQVVTETDALRLAVRRRPEAIPVVAIENPFERDHGWHIEGVIEWIDERPGDLPGDPPVKQDYPAYFAVTAGQVQAGVVWAPREKAEHGSGGGARLFKQEDALQGVDGLFRDFCGWHDPRRRAAGPDRALIDRWERGRAHRFRLEGGSTEVRFFLAPADAEWPPKAPLVRRVFGARELSDALALGDGQRVFRIVSLGRCRIRSIELRGLLK